MGEPEKMTFEEFWPYYLAEHSRGVTRAFHLLATLAWMALLAAAIATRTWWLALLMPVAAYGLAWFSHFFLECNRPATFKHPLYSLLADHRMAFYMVTGRMGAELARLGIKPKA
jgi:hypothetical protein